jgi:hypothetical protein
MSGRGERGSPFLAHPSPPFKMINVTPRELLLGEQEQTA